MPLMVKRETKGSKRNCGQCVETPSKFLDQIMLLLLYIMQRTDIDINRASYTIVLLIPIRHYSSRSDHNCLHDSQKDATLIKLLQKIAS
jgi:hypothetical protein